MKTVCGFCGLELEEEQVAKACSGCGAFGGCKLVKCPRCGYEQAREPDWLKRIRSWFGSKAQHEPN